MSLLPDPTSARGVDRPGIGPRLVFSLVAGALLAAGVAAASPGPFGAAWLAAAALLIPAVLVLYGAWQWGGRGRALAWVMVLAFVLRLGLGVGLSLALPVWGYAEPEQQAGYLFKDASNRDTQAWKLARSGEPLWASFRDEFATDQYGGLLALSAAVYRLLSPDAQRPYLILILGAFFTALGAPFLRAAIRLRWSARAAAIALWIYALYPDGIFFGASQMREPILVGLGAILFWAVLAWEGRAWTKWAALLGSLLGMALISSRVAAAVAGFMGLLFLLEYIVGHSDRRWRLLGWSGLALGSILLLGFSWEWFHASTQWDVRVTQSDSGWVAKIVSEATHVTHLPAEQLGPLITTAYGLARPLLPAAVAEDATSVLWKTLGIVRAVGWYALAPFLVYGLFAVWKERDAAKRRRAIWLALTVGLWLVIASARGGGDGIDNPRYRSLFLPWLALLAGWSIDWALAQRDAWLWRWIAVEVVFLGFFTNWYFSRYFHTWARLPFWVMLACIAGLSALILVGGWGWDRWRSKNRLPLQGPEA